MKCFCFFLCFLFGKAFPSSVIHMHLSFLHSFSAQTLHLTLPPSCTCFGVWCEMVSCTSLRRGSLVTAAPLMNLTLLMAEKRHFHLGLDRPGCWGLSSVSDLRFWWEISGHSESLLCAWGPPSGLWREVSSGLLCPPPPPLSVSPSFLWHCLSSLPTGLSGALDKKTGITC